MKKIYIAGPMTGMPKFNYPAFFEAERLLKGLNYDVLNPASLPKCDDDSIKGDERWRWYMRRALPMVAQADEMALLPGWDKSKGALLEVNIGSILLMPMWYCSHGQVVRLEDV